MDGFSKLLTFGHGLIIEIKKTNFSLKQNKKIKSGILVKNIGSWDTIQQHWLFNAEPKRPKNTVETTQNKVNKLNRFKYNTILLRLLLKMSRLFKKTHFENQPNSTFFEQFINHHLWVMKQSLQKLAKIFSIYSDHAQE